MKLRVIRSIVRNLSDRKTNEDFMRMVELRQRIYQDLKSDVLIMDQYDLIADHLMLFSDHSDNKLIGYIRSIPSAKCRQFQIEFPIATLVKRHPEYELAYRRFQKEAIDPIQVGYLCVDPDYRSELRGIKALDFLAWVSLKISGVPEEKASFATTLNNKYKMDPIVENMGECVPDLPDFIHPTIPESHRLTLVPRIRPDYWEEQRQKFAEVYQGACDGFGYLLEAPADSRRREAA